MWVKIQNWRTRKDGSGYWTELLHNKTLQSAKMSKPAITSESLLNSESIHGNYFRQDRTGSGI